MKEAMNVKCFYTNVKHSNVQTFLKPISNAKHSNLERRVHQNLYLVWSQFIGESLNTEMDLDNVHDKGFEKSSCCRSRAYRNLTLLQFCFKFGRNNGRNCDWRPRKQRKWNGGTVQIQTEGTKDIFIKSRIYN